MKKVLIVAGILIVLVFLSLTLLSVFNPQGLADFFMNIAASEFDVEIDGRDQEVKMKNLGDGVTSSDRLFILQKMVALYIMSEEDDRVTPAIIEEYNREIVNAAADNELSKNEFLTLKDFHSEIVTEEEVRQWIKIAQRYEDSMKEKAREETK